MFVKLIILLVILHLSGLNAAKNVRKGYRTKLKGYYVRGMISLSLFIETILLWNKIWFWFYLILVITVVFIVITAGHVQELRKHETENTQEK
jgi:fatty acid desaturase